MSAADDPMGPSPERQRRRKRRRGIQAAAVIGVVSLVIAGLQFASDQCWLGLGSCPPGHPDVRIDPASSVFNAPGYDDPADEYICLVNASDEQVELAGWQLRDGGGDVVNTLPGFAFAPGAKVRVHPGQGRDSGRNLFGTSGAPIWTNGGDAVTLVDADGERVASASYGEQEEGDSVACG